MQRALRASIVLSCAVVLRAQAPAAGEPQGLEAAWEIAPVLQELAAHAGRMQAQFDKLKVASWVEKGASDTYLAQAQSGKEQARALASEAKALAANPEKLSASLQALFRLQALDSMAASLADGARRYQSTKDGQELAALSAESGAGRERFQRYIVNLAAEREQEFQVMDREAQRCRGIVTQTPRPARKR